MLSIKSQTLAGILSTMTPGTNRFYNEQVTTAQVTNKMQLLLIAFIYRRSRAFNTLRVSAF